MSSQQQAVVAVGSVRLADELERRVAMVSVSVGPVTIRNVAVWRSRSGKLKALFPAQREGRRWYDLVELPAKLRAEVEADVIAAYKAAKAEAAKETERRQ